MRAPTGVGKRFDGLALGLLCVVLVLWTPWTVAGELVATLPSIGMRGPAAVVELSLHAAGAALSVAAGWALWNGIGHGPLLARAALVASAAVQIQTLYWSALPSQVPPGGHLPLAVLALGHAALWLLYLHRSPRVRAIADA